MKILKGKRAGDGYKLHQWANDWITYDNPDGTPSPHPVHPLNVQVEGDEEWRMLESYVAWWQHDDRRCGHFWPSWDLQPDGTYRPRRPTGELGGRHLP